MRKKVLSLVLALTLALSAVALSACGSSSDSSSSSENDITIAIPNDATNEARALLLLQDNGYIKLKKGAGITATIKDIKDSNGITFKEVEAAQVPNTLKDVDFGVINSNYAIDADLNPVKDSLIIEGSAAKYANIIAVKKSNANKPLTKALVAAMESKKVKNFIEKKYNGSIMSTVENPTNGYDSSVDYSKLSGKTITVAASPAPHADILKVAKKILAKKNITLEIKEFTDYVQPNNVVESGEVYANYFQHKPYLDNFNEENDTHLVSVAAIHNEPMGLYAGKTSSLKNVKKLS